jgi:hypothetical protein
MVPALHEHQLLMCTLFFECSLFHSERILQFHPLFGRLGLGEILKKLLPNLGGVPRFAFQLLLFHVFNHLLRLSPLIHHRLQKGERVLNEIECSWMATVARVKHELSTTDLRFRVVLHLLLELDNVLVLFSDHSKSLCDDAKQEVR